VRSAGNDNACGVPEFFDWYFAREDFGRNSDFPNFTRNEVAVLTAGIEYDDLRQLLSHPLVRCRSLTVTVQ
jgi:hypothetical protein